VAAAFADQAVAALRDAFQAGWGQYDDLKEPDFDAIRGREDFKKLLAQLETRSKAKAANKEWLARPAVQERGRQLLAGFEGWQKQHPTSRREFPRMPSILLHSLSHMLITAVALECGYPASSIRERVYALGAGYGILLYTGTPDAEGTLGGLIETARQMNRHLRAALELARLCSNDPVCAQHEPQSTHEARFLHGAACHGCVLIAETSCEQHNDFLDRALVVPTVEDLGAEFFTSE
jgi:hypothetical protein